MSYEEFCKICDRFKQNIKNLSFADSLNALVMLALFASTVDDRATADVLKSTENLLKGMQDPINALQEQEKYYPNDIIQCEIPVFQYCKCINVNVNKEDK